MAVAKTDIRLDKRYQRAGKNWTPGELAYLSRHYGIRSNEEICQFLQRSPNALKIAAYRKLNGLKRKDNFYTSREVARSLGVRDAKTIIGWVKKGWLPYNKGPMFTGLNRVWSFSEQDIIKLLRRRPYLVTRENVKQFIFRKVIDEEWERDPWYTPAEAMHFLEVKTIDAVHRYISQGLLKAKKKPGGPWQGVWIVRHSTIQEFLKNDPRPAHKVQALRKARRQVFLSKGNPVRLFIVWLLKCPRCRQEVEVVAPVYLRGPIVKEHFIRLFLNGKCSHSDVAYLGGLKINPPFTQEHNVCPKCGGPMYDDEDGKKCFACAKIVYK